jgi:methylenetetrahydrofolate--tRNA-(uracil-5-)-methyltransferase
MLIREMELLDSLIISTALTCRVPAGHAFSVDREKFSMMITKKLDQISNIQVIRKEIENIPDGSAIIASGPLTSPKLSNSLTFFLGSDQLFFYDAIAPIIEADSIDKSIAFRGSRYGKGEAAEGDYFNCPLTKHEYIKFIKELLAAERYPLKEFEGQVIKGVKAGKGRYYDSCLPIEVMAERGLQTLAFGPMRPIGITDSHTGEKPYAIVQLRQEDKEGKYLGMVGFQTNLLRKEQVRVFRLIPGMENVVFSKFGQMHKNTYIFSPEILLPTLQTHKREDLFIAGQIAGVEGYIASAATGLLAGVNASRQIQGKDLVVFPNETMLGALCASICDPTKTIFQPVKESYGILPPLGGENLNKKQRHFKLYEREQEVFYGFIKSYLS